MNHLDISVIIPFKDKARMTLSAVTSLLNYGPNVTEILLVSNNSSQQELDVIYAGIADIPNARVLIYDAPFNYQKMNNWAVKQAKGAYILFQNNDTELYPESKGLLENMAKEAAKPDVGITGCLLLYGDRVVIQHAGVFLYPRGMADHLYIGQKLVKVLQECGPESTKYPYDIKENIPMTAVTGAVNIIEKKKFDEVGGYDEKFIIGGGDVDLCIRLNKRGYQTWYVAGGWIVHKESQSRAHKPITYNDFYQSYLSYINGYDLSVGDPYLPLITKDMP